MTVGKHGRVHRHEIEKRVRPVIAIRHHPTRVGRAKDREIVRALAEKGDGVAHTERGGMHSQIVVERAGTEHRKVEIGVARQKERERLVVPADSAEAAKLAPRYSNGALGAVAVRRGKGGTIFDVGEWRSSVATRRNDDGTLSFITIDPTIGGFEFVAGSRDGNRTLTLRDAQHEYVFVESL